MSIRTIVDAIACGRCGAPMTATSDDAAECVAGHRIRVEHGVVDLYVPRAAPDDEAKRQLEKEVLAAIGAQLSMSVESLEASRLLEPLPPTGDPFLDAEEDTFAERFPFVDALSKLKIRRMHHPARLRAGDTHHVTVRLANEGAAPIPSIGPLRAMLGYRWITIEGVAGANGARSELPVSIAPGRAITTHVKVAAPPRPGVYRLEIFAVREGMTFDCKAVSGDITVEPSSFLHRMLRLVRPSRAARRDADRDPGVPFSEPRDDELSRAFIDKFMDMGPEPIRGVELGGGILPLVPRRIRDRGGRGTIVNCDISVRVLRIAALISARESDQITLHARLDATRMPFVDDSLDVACFCRSLHHFEDPVEALRECHRVLRPGGLLLLLSEPVAHEYDEPTLELIRGGINEQVFPLDAYEGMIVEAGFEPIEMVVDWGVSLKAALRKPHPVGAIPR